MNRLLIFGRSPLVWIAFLQTLLAFLVTVPVAQGAGLTQTIANSIVVLAGVVFTVWDAALARPVSVSLITGAVRTGLIALAAFGWHLSDVQLTTAVGLLSVTLALLTQPNTTPAGDPAEGFDTRS